MEKNSISSESGPSPQLLQSICDALGTKRDDGTSQKINSCIAAGKICKDPEVAEPLFQIKDLLIVVEVKHKVVTKDSEGKEETSLESLGAYSFCDCSALLNPKEGNCVSLKLPKDSKFTVTGRNDFNPDIPDNERDDTMLQEWHALRDGSGMEVEADWRRCLLSIMFGGVGRRCKDGSHTTTVILIRQDDWRSFYLCKDRPLDFDRIILHAVAQDRREELLELSTSFPVPKLVFSTDSSGIVARDTIGKNDLVADLYFNLVSKLPAQTSDDEPGWLQKMRRAERLADLNWTDKDEADLQNIRTFSFCLDSIIFELSLEDSGGYGRRLNEKDVLHLLDGLQWKESTSI
jgi:hypothetical protein